MNSGTDSQKKQIEIVRTGSAADRDSHNKQWNRQRQSEEAVEQTGTVTTKSKADRDSQIKQ